MVEANRNADAVLMISELAKLLRISLSKGKTIIRIADEIQHSKSYMSIQMVRYKERFGIKFDIDEEINDYCIVKLVIQPILENAIYYGVGDMDADEGGMITVTGRKIEEDIYISIEDNGMGMREEVVENIPLTSIVLETDCPYMAENIHRIATRYLSQHDVSLVEAAVDGWANSETHLRNIRNERLNAIGVGIAKGINAAGEESWYCVQLFLYDGCVISQVDIPIMNK